MNNKQSIGLSLLLATAICAPLRAGEPEVLCNGTPWHWDIDASNPTPIQWRIARDTAAFQRRVVPGFPGLKCSSGGTQRPGVQSIVRAARSWTRVNIPGYPATTSQHSNFSTFQLEEPFSGFIRQDTQVNQSLFGFQDGINVVTCLEAPSTFTTLGFAGAVVGATAVWLDTTTGEILEADIALGVRLTDSVLPAIECAAPSTTVFVEHNDSTGTTLLSRAPDSGSTFFDLEGVVTHEFGHFAGLAHSLVDSEYDGAQCLVPTMFPIAQSEPLGGGAESFCASSSDCTQPTSISLGNVSIFGRCARTLKYDDKVGLGTNYPRPAFSNFFGTIKGKVISDPESGGALGNYMTAIKSNEAEAVRVGVVVQKDGSYTIPGLKPGTYHLQMESTDGPRAASSAGSMVSNLGTQSGLPGGPAWFYFPYFPGDGLLPFLLQNGSGGAPWDPTFPNIDDCGALTYSAPEFWDDSENPFQTFGHCEPFGASHADPLGVVAGGTQTRNFSFLSPSQPGVDLTGECCFFSPTCATDSTIKAKPIALWVGLASPTTGFASPRGLNLSAAILGIVPGGQVTFSTAGPMTISNSALGSAANTTATLRLSTNLEHLLRPNNELEQLGGQVFQQNATMNNNSIGTWQFTLANFPPAGFPQNHCSVFAQVEIAPVFGDTILSNVVTVKVTL